jgi:hypothetical protein
MDIIEQHQELANLVRAADSVGDALRRLQDMQNASVPIGDLQSVLSMLQSRIAGMFRLGHQELECVWTVELERLWNAYGIEFKEEESDWMLTDGKPRE